MNKSKPKGYFNRILFVDVETSGMAFGVPDPTHYPQSTDTYQIVSIGLIVVDADTLQPIEKLYREVKWNGESVWEPKAEAVHGLSLTHLEENGVSEEDAAVEVAELIIKYWGTESPVSLGGHNVATFDRYFLQRLMSTYDIPIKYAARTIDSNAIGFATFGSYSSDELFSLIGCTERDPNAHNALTDAENSLKVLQIVRKMFDACAGE